MKRDAFMSQMLVVLKKLTYAALLSPSEASEEFREGVIKCFRALLLNLHHCSNQSCLCKQSLDLPMLLATRDMLMLNGTLKFDLEQGECLLAFWQSEAASAAVGHWLSLLLKVHQFPFIYSYFWSKFNLFVLPNLFHLILHIKLICVL